MADRSVSVTLRANVADFRSQIRQAGTSLDDLAKKGDKTGQAAGTAFGRMAQSMQLQREHWTTAGTAATAFGVASAAALGASAKAAIDWESAFAGVLKTVDGSATELAAIEDGLRSMAQELPASHAEIAAVAEAAGQLGIQTPNVLEFTRTMIDMGESTSMSADEAATQLARFVNIMGTSQSEFSNIGSAVVALGNNFATTEGEIVEMSLRLAGAGAQLGLSEAEVLALSTAMSSLGIEAEAGGTAMSQTMIQMRNAVDEGGSSLEAFASAAGVSTTAFQELFASSPADALLAVVAGLGEMEAQGINTSSVLSEMGATGLRQSDALRRLSGDATILGDAFAMATEAYADNSALADEAAQRYETVASKMAMAKNSIVDAGISLGSVFMPAIAGVAEGVQSFASFLAGLPDPLQAVAGGLGATATVASLAGGGFLLLAPRVYDTVVAFQALHAANLAGTAGNLGKIAAVLPKLALPIAAFAGVAFLNDQLNGVGSVSQIPVEELAGALTDVADSGETAADALTKIGSNSGDIGLFTNEISNLQELLDDLAPSFEKAFGQSTWNKIERFADSPGDPVGKARDKIRQLDDALTLMVSSGDVETAGELYGELAAILVESGMGAEEAERQFNGYHGALSEFLSTGGSVKELAGDWQLIREAMGGGAPMQLPDGSTVWDFADATGEAADATGELAAAAETLGISEDALQGIYDSQIGTLQELIELRRGISEGAGSIVDAEAAHRDAVDGLTEALEDESIALDRSTGMWDGYTDAGKIAGDASRDMTTAMWDMAESMHAQGESQDAITEKLSGMRGDFIDLAMDMGATREQAEALADEYGMFPETISTSVDIETAEAGRVLNGFLVDVDSSSGEVTVNGQTVNAEDSLASLLGLIADSEGMVTINGNSYEADMTLAEFLAIADGSTGTADIAADDTQGQSILSRLLGDIDGSYEEVDVGGNTSPASGDVGRLLTDTKNRDTYVNVGANMGPFNNTVGSILGKTIGSALVNVTTNYRGSSGMATGGYVSGPGTGTSDSIPVRLSNGEYVVKAASVAKYGVDFLNRVNAGSLTQGNYVSARSSSPVVNVGAPSLAGLQIVGQIQVGDAIVPLVDARIVAADRKKQIVGRRP